VLLFLLFAIVPDMGKSAKGKNHCRGVNSGCNGRRVLIMSGKLLKPWRFKNMKNFCEILCILKSVDEVDNDHYLEIFMCSGCLHSLARQKPPFVGSCAAPLLKSHFHVT